MAQGNGGQALQVSTALMTRDPSPWLPAAPPATPAAPGIEQPAHSRHMLALEILCAPWVASYPLPAGMASVTSPVICGTVPGRDLLTTQPLQGHWPPARDSSIQPSFPNTPLYELMPLSPCKTQAQQQGLFRCNSLSAFLAPDGKKSPAFRQSTEKIPFYYRDPT